jgi:hypothetical protein
VSEDKPQRVDYRALLILLILTRNLGVLLACFVVDDRTEEIMQDGISVLQNVLQCHSWNKGTLRSGILMLPKQKR